MKSNVPLKRVVAYLIDLVVITLISSALTYITFINPKYEEYKNVSAEYTSYVEKYYQGNTSEQTTGDKTKYIESQITDFLDQHKATTLKEELEEIKSTISNYDFNKGNDELIKKLKSSLETLEKSENKEEASSLIEKIEDYISYLENDDQLSIEDLQEKIQDLNYELTKTGYVYTIGNIIIIFLYFGVFAFITKGQTLGKKLMRIKIVSKKKQEVKLYQYLIRAFILNGVILNVVSLIAVCFNKETFNTIYTYGSNFDTILMIVNFLLIMFASEGRGIHDLLAGTKVVEVTNEQVLEEAEPEVIKPEKKKKSSKNDE